MKTHIIASPRFISACCFLLFLTLTSFSQTFTDLRSNSNQAEYVVISPTEYKAAAEQLTSFRSAFNSMSTAVVITDSIYSQFKSTSTPDSAIREFITYAVTSWKTPSPKYFVLAGNTNSVPLHLEEGLQLPPVIEEDSIPVDWWFVEGAFKQATKLIPIATVGRFPAWNIEQLQTMVSKTIAYQTQEEAAWMDKGVIVADYDSLYNTDFKPFGFLMSNSMQPLWKDTVVVDVQTVSSGNFMTLWNSGIGAINFVGNANEMYFSRSRFFSTTDVPSLINMNMVPVCFFTTGGQRFEREDSLTLVVNLLQEKNGGGVAVIASSGAVYLGLNIDQNIAIFNELKNSDTTRIGDALRVAKINGLSQDRKTNLLGDPALTIRHRLTLSIKPPKGTITLYSLEQNYPNPFNPATTIQFNVPSESFVTLKVYNLLGQEITTLVNEVRSGGIHHVQFNASALAAGVYIYRMQAGSFFAARKLVLVK